MTIPKTYQILTNLNCNLDCSYCYEKKCDRVNDDVLIDQYLKALFERDKDNPGDVNIEMVGGETLLYPYLVNGIIQRGLVYGEAYGIKVNFSLSTNGTLLTNPKVIKNLLPYKHCLSIGISIDGNKEVHDKNRVYAATGKGSYDDVVAGIVWLKENWCPSRWGVKATFTAETMPEYMQSIRNIHKLGCNDISANLIFEDHADYLTCLTQFTHVANYLMKNPELTVQQFSKDKVAIAGKELVRDKNYCGSTKYMTCLGFDGYIYGCNRFCTMSKNNMYIGKLNEGKIVHMNHALVTKIVDQHNRLPERCNQCKVQHMCPMCVAAPFEEELKPYSYYDQQRMCGWAYALATVHLYLKGLLYHKGA